MVSKVSELYEKISALPSLRPCKDVDTLFSELVRTCIPNSSVDVTQLPPKLQQTRSHLIKLCAQAESLLESHFSTLLASSHPHDPLLHLSLFPYFPNYLKLAALESGLLSDHYSPARVPARLAFIGSGPLPLTSIVLASHHLPATTFHNFDIDPAANAMARRLVASDAGLSGRMVFHTADVMEVGEELRECEVVFLAALVGMEKEEKRRVVEHLGQCMAPGAVLMLRSAHGARAFLYPVLDPCELGEGFEVLSVYHPKDEVINSVIVARKRPTTSNASNRSSLLIDDHHRHHREGLISMARSCKCCCDEVVHVGNKIVIEELTIEE